MQFVELSNVSAVEELVSSIENQRHYEINIKMITTIRTWMKAVRLY